MNILPLNRGRLIRSRRATSFPHPRCGGLDRHFIGSRAGAANQHTQDRAKAMRKFGRLPFRADGEMLVPEPGPRRGEERSARSMQTGIVEDSGIICSGRQPLVLQGGRTIS